MRTSVKALYTVVGLSAVLSSGCASIMSGRHQEVTFQSNPDGATVTVAGRTIGKTPITTALEKKSGQPLIFSKDGYKPVSMTLETRMNSWFWGNIVVGGLIGSSTDGITGSVYEYSPSQYMVSLSPEGSSLLESKTSQSDRQKAKEYIVMGYKDIMADLHRGDGQYLTSLFGLLKIPSDRTEDAIKKLRALEEVYRVIPEFADHVLDLYLPAGTDKGGML